MTDVLANLVAARRAGEGGIHSATQVRALLTALDAFIASDEYRVAALRADGLFIFPDGSPSRSRWTVTQLVGASHSACVGYVDSESAAIDLAEATPL